MLENKRLTVQIKGIKDGLLITLSEGDWLEVQEDLLSYVDEQQNFFKGAKITLDVGERVIHAADLGTLRDKLSDREVSLWAILSHSHITEQAAQMLGMGTKIATNQPKKITRPADTNLAGEMAVMVNRTLRSGFRISYEGHVVVIGDVNPGAEIVAGGSVVVWGNLRGMVHAGANGDESAVVCALNLTPTQLRIAGFIAVTPTRRDTPQPEVARVVDDNVIAEPWEYK